MTDRNEAVGQFVERFAAILTDTGMARMPARVLTALLTTDSGRLTAAEVAEVLQISPAAVSSALPHLTHLRLVSRERAPGSRRDVYRVHADLWYRVAFQRDQLVVLINEVLAEGVRALGDGSAAGRRLDECLEYFRFAEAELGSLMERWSAHREKWLAERRAD